MRRSMFGLGVRLLDGRLCVRPLSFRPKRSAVENTPCGDAGGWTALLAWETGDRLGRARIKSLTIL